MARNLNLPVEPDIPQSVWQGTFVVFGVTLHCHVLDNGERIIEQADMIALLEAMAAPATPMKWDDHADLALFVRWERGS